MSVGLDDLDSGFDQPGPRRSAGFDDGAAVRVVGDDEQAADEAVDERQRDHRLAQNTVRSA